MVGLNVEYLWFVYNESRTIIIVINIIMGFLYICIIINFVDCYRDHITLFEEPSCEVSKMICWSGIYRFIVYLCNGSQKFMNCHL